MVQTAEAKSQLPTVAAEQPSPHVLVGSSPKVSPSPASHKWPQKSRNTAEYWCTRPNTFPQLQWRSVSVLFSVSKRKALCCAILSLSTLSLGKTLPVRVTSTTSSHTQAFLSNNLLDLSYLKKVSAAPRQRWYV